MKILTSLLILSALLLAWWLLPVEELFQHTLDACRSMGVWGAVLFFLAYVILAHLLVPITPITVAAGSVFGLEAGYAVTGAASLACAASGYLLGRTYLRERVERWLRRHPVVQSVQTAIADEGAIMVFWLRLGVVMPFMLANLVFGFTRVSLGKYLLASWLGMLPGTILYLYMGMLGERLVRQSDSFSFFQWTLSGVGLAVALGLGVFIAAKAKARLKRRPRKRPSHARLGRWRLPVL